MEPLVVGPPGKLCFWSLPSLEADLRDPARLEPCAF